MCQLKGYIIRRLHSKTITVSRQRLYHFKGSLKCSLKYVLHFPNHKGCNYRILHSPDDPKTHCSPVMTENGALHNVFEKQYKCKKKWCSDVNCALSQTSEDHILWKIQPLNWDTAKDFWSTKMKHSYYCGWHNILIKKSCLLSKTASLQLVKSLCHHKCQRSCDCYLVASQSPEMHA